MIVLRPVDFLADPVDESGRWVRRARVMRDVLKKVMRGCDLAPELGCSVSMAVFGVDTSYYS